MYLHGLHSGAYFAAREYSPRKIVLSASYALHHVKLWRFLHVLRGAYNELQNGSMSDRTSKIGEPQSIRKDEVIKKQGLASLFEALHALNGRLNVLHVAACCNCDMKAIARKRLNLEVEIVQISRVIHLLATRPTALGLATLAHEEVIVSRKAIHQKFAAVTNKPLI